MSSNRRKFLKIGTFAAVAAAAIPLRASGMGVVNDKRSSDRKVPFPHNGLGTYSLAAFTSCLNSTFRVYSGHKTIEVKLVEVADLSRQAAPDRECFSLRFVGGRIALPQNSYGVDHPKLGSFPLFLVPAGKDGGAHDFVAIVNRL